MHIFSNVWVFVMQFKIMSYDLHRQDLNTCVCMHREQIKVITIHRTTISKLVCQWCESHKNIHKTLRIIDVSGVLAELHNVQNVVFEYINKLQRGVKDLGVGE